MLLYAERMSTYAPSPRCETPKSPPGDYNRPFRLDLSAERYLGRVKHLNPRQGITIATAAFPSPPE